MAQLDRLIHLATENGAEQITLKAGEKAFFVAGGVQRNMTSQGLAAKQVMALLAEVMPPERRGDAAQEQNFNFRYATSAGAFRIEVTWQGGAPALHIRPEVRTEEPATVSSDLRYKMEGLLHEMVQSGCSDLHLTSGNPPTFRKDGELTFLGQNAPIPSDTLQKLVFSITPETNRFEFEKFNDTDFSHEIQGLARFRANLFRDRCGVGAVFRNIPTAIPSVQQMGLSDGVLALCTLPKGIVIVTGPTGSGKSTTLAAMIDHINKTRSAHIITIEDPIEFVYPPSKCLINQREVGSHTTGFTRALRAALREDPDIILVGDMRDPETVAIALETAEAGHLVFGTMHMNTVASTVDRIIDQFPHEQQSQVQTMLASSLKGVIAQTLCRKERGGRVAAREILLVNSTVSNLIREGKTFQIASVMQTSKGAGMISLNDSLLDLVKKGIVDVAEAYANAVSRTEFADLLQRNGLQAPEGATRPQRAMAGAAQRA